MSVLLPGIREPDGEMLKSGSEDGVIGPRAIGSMGKVGLCTAHLVRFLI